MLMIQNIENFYIVQKFKKDYAAVHQTYDLIKKASPLKYQYYLEDAKVYKEQNDETNAILNIEKANEINPNNFLSNFELYQYYQELWME